jgi:hypothetical protein
LYWTGKENTSEGSWKQFEPAGTSHGNYLSLSPLAKNQLANGILITGGVVAIIAATWVAGPEGGYTVAQGLWKATTISSGVISTATGTARALASTEEQKALASNLPTCTFEALTMPAQMALDQNGFDPNIGRAIRTSACLFEFGLSGKAYAKDVYNGSATKWDHLSFANAAANLSPPNSDWEGLGAGTKPAVSKALQKAAEEVKNMQGTRYTNSLKQ